MDTQTPADIKKALSQKLKVTKNGFEATVKADTPDEAITLAVQVVERFKARGVEVEVAAKTPSEHPATLWFENGRYYLRHGGGENAIWNPDLQELSEDYRVKIELEKNSRSFNTAVSIKGGTTAEMFALLEYTETKLTSAFAPAVQ